MSLLSDGKSYSITLTNNSGVLYKERLTNNSVQIGDTLMFQVTGTALKDSIMSNAAQHNVLRGRTEIVANAVALGGSSGGSGGGINVIEYDPTLHEVVTDTVVGADLEPTRPNGFDDVPTSSWNSTTGVMGIASASQTLRYPNNNAEYVGLRVTPSLYGMRGLFTIDASLCEDAWGFALLEHEDYGGFPIDLDQYLTNQHYKTVEYSELSQPQTFGWLLTEADEYANQQWGTEPFSSQYARNESNPIATKPQGVYTFNIGTLIEAYMEFTGLSYEQLLETFNATSLS